MASNSSKLAAPCIAPLALYSIIPAPPDPPEKQVPSPPFPEYTPPLVV